MKIALLVIILIYQISCSDPLKANGLETVQANSTNTTKSQGIDNKIVTTKNEKIQKSMVIGQGKGLKVGGNDVGSIFTPDPVLTLQEIYNTSSGNKSSTNTSRQQKNQKTNTTQKKNGANVTQSSKLIPNNSSLTLKLNTTNNATRNNQKSNAVVQQGDTGRLFTNGTTNTKKDKQNANSSKSNSNKSSSSNKTASNKNSNKTNTIISNSKNSNRNNYGQISEQSIQKIAKAVISKLGQSTSMVNNLGLKIANVVSQQMKDNTYNTEKQRYVGEDTFTNQQQYQETIQDGQQDNGDQNNQYAEQEQQQSGDVYEEEQDRQPDDNVQQGDAYNEQDTDLQPIYGSEQSFQQTQAEADNQGSQQDGHQSQMEQQSQQQTPFNPNIRTNKNKVDRTNNQNSKQTKTSRNQKSLIPIDDQLPQWGYQQEQQQIAIQQSSLSNSRMPTQSKQKQMDTDADSQLSNQVTDKQMGDVDQQGMPQLEAQQQQQQQQKQQQQQQLQGLQEQSNN